VITGLGALGLLVIANAADASRAENATLNRQLVALDARNADLVQTNSRQAGQLDSEARQLAQLRSTTATSQAVAGNYRITVEADVSRTKRDYQDLALAWNLYTLAHDSLSLANLGDGIQRLSADVDRLVADS
jgi:hypothetical protein